MKLHVLFGVFGLALSMAASAQTALIKKLDRFSSNVEKEVEAISPSRKEVLSEFADNIIYNNLKKGNSNVVFVDANNSANSQAAQLLFHMAAVKYNVNNVNVLSAGISEGNIDPLVISLIEEAGYKVSKNNTFPKNVRYTVSYSWDESKLLMFSKNLKNFQIPNEKLILVSMDGSEVSGSEKVINLSYGALSKETFDQIASEMFYVARKLQNNQLLSHQQ